MKIYLFQSEMDLRMFGFTSDSTGENLPSGMGPWHRAVHGAKLLSNLSKKLADTKIADPVLKAMNEDGFFLARSGGAASRTIH